VPRLAAARQPCVQLDARGEPHCQVPSHLPCMQMDAEAEARALEAGFESDKERELEVGGCGGLACVCVFMCACACVRVCVRAHVLQGVETTLCAL